MNRIFAQAAFFSLSASVVYAQDSTWRPKLAFDISAIHLYHTGEDYGPVLNGETPPNIGPAVPYGHGPFARYGIFNASDEPTYHGAQSLDLTANAEMLTNVDLIGDLIAEHRGASYGVYSTKNIIVYPRIDFIFDTAASLFGERFVFQGIAGNFTNMREVEGLLLYNVDGQGEQASIGWHRLHLNYYHIGDMVEGIGLNSDDAIDYTASLEDVQIAGAWRGRIEGGWFIYNNYWHKQIWSIRQLDTVIRGDTEDYLLTSYKPVPFVMGNTGWTLAAALMADSLRIYSEYRYRNPLSPTGTLQSKSALLVGASNNIKSDRFSLQARAEYRFYGLLFNDNYINEDVSYRGQSTSSDGYGATIGPYLYPLTQFLRPFSQWAVFTEYQGRDVAGYTLLLDSKWFFYDRFALNALLDLNAIKAADLSATFYPFYNLGVSWEPAKNTGLFASMTNREMNLDKHYPTLYLLKNPALQLEVRFNFDQKRY